MKNKLKQLIGWIRLKVWGFCPKCNSDAPKLYDCEVCNWENQYEGYKFVWWNRFIKQLKQPKKD